MTKEEKEEHKRLMDRCLFVSIVPTNKLNEEGYHTGKITVFERYSIEEPMKEINSWISDCFQISGDKLCGDFESDGGILLWSTDKRKPLKIRSGQTTRIYGEGCKDYDLI